MQRTGQLQLEGHADNKDLSMFLFSTTTAFKFASYQSMQQYIGTTFATLYCAHFKTTITNQIEII